MKKKKVQGWTGVAIAAAISAVALGGCSRTFEGGSSGSGGNLESTEFTDADGSGENPKQAESAGVSGAKENLGMSKLVGIVATDGSTSMEKVIGALGEAFENQNDGVTFTYNPTGSGSGIQAVQEGRCDIGLSSRNLKEEELAGGLEATILAYDGIAVIVNLKNPVADLDVETIAKLYTGEIANWKDVGGEDAPVVLVGREAGSGTRDGFEAITKTAEKCQYRQELTSTGDVITAVSQNPDAIGYASLASLKDSVRALTVGGVAPTEDTVRDGSYVIQRPFVLVTRTDADLSDVAQAFFDFAVSPDASKWISDAGAVAAN